jgi:hypothetical protein
MATRTAVDVESALEVKGMDRDENHHHMFRKQVGGVMQLVTRVSHSKGEVNDHLGKLMGNQCCLQLKEFWDLVDCTLTEDQWDALVAQRCRDGRNPFLGY